MSFPIIPSWEGIHPALVQFPIVLLLVAPVLLIVSLFARRAWRTWAGASLLLMMLGAFATWLAVASGHAGGQLVVKTPELEQAIARHEAFGIMTRNMFTLLAVVYALVMLAPAMIKQQLPAAARISLHALFLVVYLGFTLLIGNTAMRGGQLVHDLGVRAMVDRSTQQAALTDVGQAQTPASPHVPQPTTKAVDPKGP